MKFGKSAVLALTLAFSVSLAACGNNNNSSSGSNASDNASNAPAASNTASTAPAETSLSGSVIASGSTALQPLVDQVAKKFSETNSGVSIQVQGGGSGTGLTQVSEGQVQIGNSDVFAEEKIEDAAKAAELKDHQVAVVAMAAVVNKEVGVTNLTKQQLVDIFTGKITNWKDLGGKDQGIVIINRPSSSGTRATFEKYALGQKTEDLKGSIQEDASGTVKKLVTETPGAIGYLAFSYIDDTVQSVQYEGVDPTTENVATGKYPVWAYEHMYTKGDPDAATQAFLDYMVSDEVQKGDVVELGYIPVSDMKIVRDIDGNITNK